MPDMSMGRLTASVSRASEYSLNIADVMTRNAVAAIRRGLCQRVMALLVKSGSISNSEKGGNINPILSFQVVVKDSNGRREYCSCPAEALSDRPSADFFGQSDRKSVV